MHEIAAFPSYSLISRETQSGENGVISLAILEISGPKLGWGGGGLFDPHHQTGSQNSTTLSPRVSKISDFFFMPFGHIVAKCQVN